MGGRQGCKLGGLVFAATHGRVMKEVRSRMSESDIVLKLFHKPDDAVWDAGEPDKLAHEAPDEWQAVESVEAAFVDDEAFVLMAPTCKKLDDAIEIVTNIVIDLPQIRFDHRLEAWEDRSNAEVQAQKLFQSA